MPAVTMLGAAGALIIASSSLPAQHVHHAPAQPDTSMHMPMPDTQPAVRGSARPLGIPMSRAGSGTSWLPDAAPMHADHVMAGGWELMLHYLVFGYYDRQNDADRAKRGDDQAGSANWAMLMASHALAGGRVQLSGMFSAEPWTVGASGYPLLLQSGESRHGLPLHDRQHPHDLFMELAAIYERAVAPNLGVQLYLAPVGEPAIGPVAFPHRPSAANDPFAPLSHHWQDATHITYGTITAAIFSRTWKLEGSIFDGREPDQDRTDFDFRTLDSYAGRLTVNPSPRWSVSASYAYLASPEELHPDDAEHRISASILNTRPFGRRGEWSSALIWGANEHSADHRLSHSALYEMNVDLDGRNALFGRFEYVNKTAEDLALDSLAGRRFDIGSASVGYMREIAGALGSSLGVGGRFAVALVPRSLTPYYGSRTPTGFAVFLRVRPQAMHAGMDMEQHGGMPMPMEGGREQR
ncbi:MAG: hypothetical protein IRY91_05705 [Gemmatimonadaceae bacterium]|nr:hypothetical protein [Gemmatimonadaceae bacterium]